MSVSFNSRFVTKKFLFSLIFIFFIFLLVFLILDGYFELKRDLKIYNADAKDIINQRINSLLSETDPLPESLKENLLFISELSSFKKFINEGDSNLNDLEEDFLSLLTQNDVYYQIIFLDSFGNEKIKAVSKDSTFSIALPSELSNQKESDYFKESLKLSRGDFFISRLSLNLENNSLENRGSLENPLYVPIINIATPIFNENNSFKGILLEKIYISYFLNDIKHFQRNNEKIFLVDSEGYYLSNPDADKEFAFSFGNNYNFYNDYPEISKETLTDFKIRDFESNDLVFSFRHIYSNNYSLILISISDKDEINKISSQLMKEYYIFLFFSCFIIFLILIFIFILTFRFNHETIRRYKK